MSNEVIQELRRAADLKERLSKAYNEKAREYRSEASEIRRLATVIEKKITLSPRSGD